MLLILIMACQDYTINQKLQGEPIIAPDFIDFGHLSSGHETGLRQIIFSNGGNATLEVDFIDINGQRFDIDTSGFDVEPLSWHAIDLSYAPETFEFNEGYLDVYLKDQEDPVGSVWFQGWGDAPVITVTPPSVDFGTLSEDCDISNEIQISNDGNIDLEITSLQELASLPQQIWMEFGSLPELPWTLAPNARISFWTEFEAVGLSLHSMELKVSSNDPIAPIKDILVEGETMISTTIIDSFTQGNTIYVDIIWIVDNSGSMSSFQNKLSTNISDFLNMFMLYSPDFKMGFITTDSHNFVNNTFFTHADPDLIVNSSALINSIGTRGSANEMGIEMLSEAIQLNRSWFRQGAALVAIFLSDEQDWSPNNQPYYSSIFDYYYPQGSFLPFAIIGDAPGGCTGAFPGWGYYDLVNHYNSQWWSICDVDWGTQMEDIALAVVNLTSYGLNHPNPKEDSIRVFVNGQEVLEGWSYNPSSNSIMFDWAKMPEVGDHVEVSYEIWECE